MKKIEQEKLLTMHKDSIDLLLKYQHPAGSFVASPTFSQYQYCWLRDSAYIAYSLLLANEIESVRLYISWAVQILENNDEKIKRLSTLVLQNAQLEERDLLGARFSLEGEDDPTDWPNYQPDGYGSLLWLITQYLVTTHEQAIPSEWKKAISLIIQYIVLVWKLPSSDCWEEFPDKHHVSTLACLAGGLESISPFLELDEKKKAQTTGSAIRTYIFAHAEKEGYFPKFIGSPLVDSSLVWLSTPYQVFESGHPYMKKTVELIERKLLHTGGTQRYKEDTYYGGGLWLPLSGFLGWHYLETGRQEEAEQLLDWIVSQCDEQGLLPEQVTTFTNDQSMIAPWEKRWGAIACPLLWSHAMFLILHFKIMHYNSQGEKNYEKENVSR
ncbi:MAG: glycoside hydrolase family 15 protein [Sphaerochaeta sp.]|nr:glycoside hydrolase family 15 protein [Sphaerochaeta sp.]